MRERGELNDIFLKRKERLEDLFAGRKGDWLSREDYLLCRDSASRQIAAHSTRFLRDVMRYRLIIIDPEGVMNKPGCKITYACANKAALTRRVPCWRTERGDSRADCFRMDCIPFLRALLLDLPTDDDGRPLDPYDPESREGLGPTPATLRPADERPRIAFVSNLGQDELFGRPGGDKLAEGEALARLQRAATRLASELGVERDALALRIYVSNYAVEGAKRPAGEGARSSAGEKASTCSPRRSPRPPTNSSRPTVSICETSGHLSEKASESSEKASESSEKASDSAASGCTHPCKPSPGMLEAAMDWAGTGAAETLTIGFDLTDWRAAYAAQTAYVDCEDLFHDPDIEERLQVLARPPAVVAPRTYGERRQENEKLKGRQAAAQRFNLEQAKKRQRVAKETLLQPMLVNDVQATATRTSIAGCLNHSDSVRL